MHLARPVVVALAAPSFRLALDHRRSVAWQRRLTELAAGALRPPPGVRVEREVLGGCPAERVTVGAAQRPGEIVYLHGGGYVVGTARMYRPLAGELARASGCAVHVLDYRRAPEHPYPAALDDAVAAARHLVEAGGRDPARLALVGDSAGGGLAVAAARVLVDAGLRPGALALLSPWTDPCDPDLPERDLVLTRAWLEACASRYRGDTDPADPGYAPMYADLSGLPPMLVHAGAHELLHAQIVRFVDRAREAGVDVRFTDLPELWHSGHLFTGMLRAASTAVREVASFIGSRVDA